MAPKRRSAPRVSLRSRRKSTPATPKVDEEELDDEVKEEEEEPAPTAEAEEEVPVASAIQDDDDDEEENFDDDEAPPPAPTPRRSQSAAHQVPKRRGPGRPRTRERPPDTPDAGDYGSDATPGRSRRGRGRGGSRGGFRGTRGRGRGRGGASRYDRPHLDADGNELEVVDDEVVLDEDLQGKQKVDEKGNLQDGREYRVRTFTIIGRDERLYMLSTEPARCTGFRDSYLFFTKHPHLYKIILNEEEKLDLIDRDIMPHSYRGRQIGVVTARSVFREFGAKIVVGGKRVFDDFQVQKAKEEGAIEGELADPLDKVPKDGSEYNRNQYVAWHGASSVYHSALPNAQVAGQAAGKRRRVAITSANWMHEHALDASRFNAELAAQRRSILGGVYDIHTNTFCYPKHMQPTVARWERVEDEVQLPPTKRPKLNGTTEHLTNGDIHMHDDDDDAEDEEPTINKSSEVFPPISNLLARNYLITDTYFEMPQHAAYPLPGPSPFTEKDHERYDIPKRGLPDLSEEELASLPEDCREALGHARQEQKEWLDAWGTELESGNRGKLRIGLGI